METKEEILGRLNNFNSQLTAMQREVVAMITLLSAPEVDKKAHLQIVRFEEGSQLAQEESSLDESPTQEQEGPTREQVIALKDLIGSGSIFATYLSPDVMKGGRGFIRPNPQKLPQYIEDLRTVSSEKLLKWPSGFYRNNDTKFLQFLLSTENYLVYLDLSPEYLFVPFVISGDQILKMTEIAPAALPKMTAALRAGLDSLCKEHGY